MRFQVVSPENYLTRADNDASPAETARGRFHFLPLIYSIQYEEKYMNTEQQAFQRLPLSCWHLDRLERLISSLFAAYLKGFG